LVAGVFLTGGVGRQIGLETQGVEGENLKKGPQFRAMFPGKPLGAMVIGRGAIPCWGGGGSHALWAPVGSGKWELPARTGIFKRRSRGRSGECFAALCGRVSFNRPTNSNRGGFLIIRGAGRRVPPGRHLTPSTTFGFSRWWGMGGAARQKRRLIRGRGYISVCQKNPVRPSCLQVFQSGLPGWAGGRPYLSKRKAEGTISHRSAREGGQGETGFSRRGRLRADPLKGVGSNHPGGPGDKGHMGNAHPGSRRPTQGRGGKKP